MKESAHSAIAAGFTKYTPASGTDELKRAICDKLSRDQGIQYEPSHILVSCGAKHTLYNLAQALLNPGDEVIIPAPYWVSYPDIVRLADGQPVVLETREADGYAIDPQRLEACITPRTKALILNGPSNPTGAVYDRKTLEAVADVATRHDVLVVSDEIYEKLVYEDTPCMSIVTAVPEMAGRTLVVNGVSKAFAMTGWRIGYAAGPQALITAMANIQSQSTSNPTSISQKAAVAALHGGTQFFTDLLDDLTPKRRLIVDALNAIPGLTCPTPAGALLRVSQRIGPLRQTPRQRHDCLGNGPGRLSIDRRPSRMRLRRTLRQRQPSPVDLYPDDRNHPTRSDKTQDGRAEPLVTPTRA